MNGRQQTTCSNTTTCLEGSTSQPAFQPTAVRFRVYLSLFCILLGSQALLDQPSANAQLLQRLFRGRPAPAPQRPVPTRPQYAPQQQFSPRQAPNGAQIRITPGPLNQQLNQPSQPTRVPSPTVAPSIAPATAVAPTPQSRQIQVPVQVPAQIASQQLPLSQMRIYQVQPQVTRIDARTGRRITTNTGPIVSVAVDPSTGRGYAVNPQTGQRLVINPATGAATVATPTVAQQTFTIDPRTGRLQVTTQPIVVNSVPSPATIALPTGQLPIGPTLAAPVASADSEANDANPASSATMGIRVVRNDDNDDSVLEVLGFLPHSRAEEAGLKVGDRIVSVNEQKTPNIASLARVVHAIGPGKTVALNIARGRERKQLQIPIVQKPSFAKLGAPTAPADSGPTIAKTPNPPAMGSQTIKPVSSQQSVLDQVTDTRQLGVEVQEQAGKRGVVITRVSEKSPAGRAGLKVGDRIFSIDGKMIADNNGLIQELSNRKNGDRFAVQLVRRNRVVSSQITLIPTPDVSAAKTPAASGDEEKNGSSALQGVGAMLGGLFGSKSKEDPTTSAKSSQPTLAPPAGPTGPKSILAPASDADEMAFGDDEPIAAKIFDVAPLAAQRPVPAQRFERSILTDPPSTKELTPPKREEPVVKAPASVSELEAEIERLKAQLKQAGK